MLFKALPAALGFPPIPAGSRSYEDAEKLARAIAGALEELRGRPDRLLSELLNLLLETSAEKTRLAVFGQAAALDGQVLDPDVRAFVLTLRTTQHNRFGWTRAMPPGREKAPSDVGAVQVGRERAAPASRPSNGSVALRIRKPGTVGGPFRRAPRDLTRSPRHRARQVVGIDESERPSGKGSDASAFGPSRDCGPRPIARTRCCCTTGEVVVPERASAHDLTHHLSGGCGA